MKRCRSSSLMVLEIWVLLRQKLLLLVVIGYTLSNMSRMDRWAAIKFTLLRKIFHKHVGLIALKLSFLSLLSTLFTFSCRET